MQKLTLKSEFPKSVFWQVNIGVCPKALQKFVNQNLQEFRSNDLLFKSIINIVNRVWANVRRSNSCIFKGSLRDFAQWWRNFKLVYQNVDLFVNTDTFSKELGFGVQLRDFSSTSSVFGPFVRPQIVVVGFKVFVVVPFMIT